MTSPSTGKTSPQPSDTSGAAKAHSPSKTDELSNAAADVQSPGAGHSLFSAAANVQSPSIAESLSPATADALAIAAAHLPHSTAAAGSRSAASSWRSIAPSATIASTILRPRRNRWLTVLLNLLAYGLAALFITPVLWLIWQSIGAPMPGQSPSLDSFRQLSSNFPIGRWMLNSLLIASLQTFLGIILCSAAGFALARHDFPGRRWIISLLLLTLILPGQALIPGMYAMMRSLGWLDTFAAIILPSAVTAFGTFLYRQGMLGLDDHMLQAARLDGAGEWRIWWQFALPQVRGITAAYALMTFLASWNNYFWPQVLLQSNDKFTLPVGMASILWQINSADHSGIVIAGVVLSLIPPALVFLLLQRDLVRGLTQAVNIGSRK